VLCILAYAVIRYNHKEITQPGGNPLEQKE
jgi:hypothetical protein